MSASVASKNIFELLGNDPPEDDDAPKVIPKEVVKSVNTTRKRDEKVAPSAQSVTGGYAPRGDRRGRGGGRYTGNEQAFRDRDAGRDSNRSKTTEDGVSPRGGQGRGRGGRRGGREHDRQSATGIGEHEKQAAHGWGAQKGESEWNDEIAAAEIAQKDAAGTSDPSDPNATEEGEAAEPEEPEEKTKTLDEYLAERAARQADLGPPQEIRRPNEGTQNKKWANAKAIERDEESGDYFAGESKDKTRNRERKQKQLLDIEPRFVEPRENRRGGDRGGRGGRGGERGRGRGAPRGDRGDRGSDRPARGSGGSGGGGGRNPAVNIMDKDAFPTLGA